MHLTKIIGFTVFSSVFAIMATALPPAASSAKKKIQKKSATSVASKNTTKRPVRKRYSPWSEPTYADSTIGDSVDGEDLVVRRAAVEALGRYNGSVVVVDPNTGRILTMVNQRLALKSGFQPCSTIKLPVAMAALIEGIISRDTLVRIYGRTRLNLTEAIAHSNNPFFAIAGGQARLRAVQLLCPLVRAGREGRAQHRR